jgi:c-di-GMP-binding flagellar brake protein YcgR
MAGNSTVTDKDELLEFSRRASELEHLTAPEQIASLLKRVKDDHSLLTVTIPGSKEHYSSAILAVRHKEGYLILDELTPRAGHSELLQAQKVYVHAKVNGIDLNFASTVISVGQEAGLAFYHIAFPTKAIYRQRRSSYRIFIGRGQSIPVTLAIGTARVIEGQLSDISVGGIAVYFAISIGSNMQLATGLAPGDVVPICTLYFDSNSKVSSQFEIRYVRNDRDRRLVRVGGRFLKLDRAQEKIIQNFVAVQERQRLKNEHR